MSQIIDRDRSVLGLDPFQEDFGGCEVGIQAANEVAAQKSLFFPAFFGEVECLLERTEDLLADLVGQGRITGVAHEYRALQSLDPSPAIG